MAEPQQRKERGYSKSGFERGDPESTFRFHLTFAKEAAKEARKNGSPSEFTRCLSHAKVALNLAKKIQRPDLEQEAQLASIDFLEIAGRRREAMEARIIAAAMVDNLEVKFESLPGMDERRVTSVDGVPIDEVIQLLEDDQHEQSPSSSGQEQTLAAEDPHGSDKGEVVPTSGPQKRQGLPTVVLEGRQIRDIQGRLATVLTDAPKLRRKPKFKE
ncbi:hypothetical protein INS49_013065 [Diaporthe citri]|uniref:uncharacterized protein n=1 Tax=Diaporthe citri TaxID=83186 RepID=UPI001C7ECEF6|nr:uncharacterized protein INS49_013065 [Diaporthe citri]KAG6359544.1 hypothetical protein INS49_013065 [Diaporthe citri]